MANFFIGTSGFLYSHWLGRFYPSNLNRQDFLNFYSQNFNTVEINASFYHIPKTKTIKTWLEKTPKNFVFSFKMSRFVTHFGKLDPKVKSFDLFFEAIEPLAKKPARHLVLIQTPSSFKANPEKLKNFLDCLPKTFLYAFEFRHPSWFCKEIYEILKKFNAAVVLSDSPIKKISNFNHQNFEQNRLWPYVNVETASFFYIRFHGSKRLFASSYTDKELKFYAKLIREKVKRGIDVYCYFNNDAEGSAIKDAKKLKEFLS